MYRINREYSVFFINSDFMLYYVQCQNSIIYPDCLRQIVGKNVTLNIEIKDGNVLIKSKIFTATDAFLDSEFSSSSDTLDAVTSSSANRQVKTKEKVVM